MSSDINGITFPANEQLDPVDKALYILKGDLSANISTILEETSQMDPWDPVACARFPLLRTLLPSGVVPTYCSEYLPYFYDRDLSLVPDDADGADMAQKIFEWRAKPTSIPFEDVMFNDIMTFLNGSYSVMFKSSDDIFKMFSNYNYVNSMILTLLNSDDMADVLRGVHLYEFLPEQEKYTGIYTTANRDLVITKAAEWWKLYFEEFDKISAQLEGQYEAYRWYSPAIRDYLYRNCDLDFTHQRIFEFTGEDMKTFKQYDMDELINFLKTHPMNCSIYFDELETYNSMWYPLFNTNDPDIKNNCLSAIIPHRRIKRMATVLADFYNEVFSGEFVVELVGRYTYKYESHNYPGMATPEEFAKMLVLKGYPLTIGG